MKRFLAIGLFVFAAPAVQASLQFLPPATEKGVHNSFWSTIYELERKQVAYGTRNGRRNFVEEIRNDLARVPKRFRLRTMERFLEITHHYRGKQDEGSDPSVRRFHEQRFQEGVSRFAEAARRIYERRKNRAYLDLFAHVRALAEAGPESAQLSRDLARFDPNNPKVLANLSRDLLDAGDPKAAVLAGEKSIRLDPADSESYTIVASAKYAMKDFQGAYDTANAALRVDPGDKIAYSIMKLTKDRVTVAPVPEDEMDEVPAVPFRAAEPAGVDGGDQLKNALLPAAARITAVRDSYELAKRSRMEIQKGEWDKAVDLASLALQKNPSNTAALFRRALANLKRKNYEAAFADTESAIRLMGDSPSPVLLTLHAQALNNLGRYAEALAAVERAAEIGFNNDRSRADGLFQKAWALGGLGRRPESRRELGRAAKLNRRYIPYYQEALDLPEDADLALLFASEWSFKSRPVQGRGTAAGPRENRNRMLMILVFSVVGGFLIALGLLHSTTAHRTRAAPIAAVAPEEADGLIAGTYKVTRRIGVGGMGVVYEALDVNLERRVAIKKMRDEIVNDPRERERFLTEARTVASLRHPNIVEIHSVVSESRDIFLVFEFVDGHTVDEYIGAYRHIPFGQAVRIIQGVGAALRYAHERGVIHRDLKPSNIMITRDGIVKVMDFGVARQAKDSLSASARTNTITGTPPYMAPEQEQGMVRRESDVYAMAVCFYEMLTGQLPFVGTGGGMTLNKINKSYIRASRRVPGLPQAFDQVLDWALDPDPDKRCKTPAKLVENLQSIA